MTANHLLLFQGYFWKQNSVLVWVWVDVSTDHAGTLLTGHLKPFKLTSVTQTDTSFLARKLVFLTFHFSSDFERKEKKMNLEKSCQGQKIRSGFLQLPGSPLKVRGLAKANKKKISVWCDWLKRTCYYFRYISETCIAIRQHYRRNGIRERLHIHFKSQF